MQRVRQCLIRPVWVRLLAAAALSWASTSTLMAQAPGVKIVRDRSEQFDALVKKANEYRRAGELLSVDEVQEQLSRTHCSLKLPQPATQKLTDREIWRRSQAAHVRVGWHYLCTRCDHWHQNLAGGYFITPDGVIATCYHLLDPEEKYREGYLVAAN